MLLGSTDGSIDAKSFLSAHEAKDRLRFLTCGSVDDGKSNLSGVCSMIQATSTMTSGQLLSAKAHASATLAITSTSLAGRWPGG